MKSVKVLTRFSNELARQSVVSLDAALRDRLVRDVAAKLDAQFFSASGDGITTPKGIFAYIGTQTLVGGALTLDKMLDAEELMLAANVDPSRLRWLLTSRDFIRARPVKDTGGRYIVQPDATEAGAYRLLGHGVTVTNRVPNTTGGTPTGREPWSTLPNSGSPRPRPIGEDPRPDLRRLRPAGHPGRSPIRRGADER